MDQKLIVIGEGPELGILKKMAGDNITFVNWLPHDQLVDYYANCKALIFPGEEDFGIVPVEAQSCGKPVIAYAMGGALETVKGFSDKMTEMYTGIFFYQQTVASLQEAIAKYETISWDAEEIHKHAQKFSKANFKSNFKKFVEIQLANFFK
jgi:glycosyltransferase involved in cell wall biosynthesis